MKIVTFITYPDGERVEADAVGFQGKTCEQLLDPVLEKLGTLTESVKKATYYQRERVPEKLRS